MKMRQVVCDFMDTAYEEKLKDFFARHYGETFSMISFQEITEEEKTGCFLTDRDLTEEEYEELSRSFEPILVMGKDLDPAMSGVEVVKSLFEAILLQEKKQRIKALQMEMEDNEERSPAWTLEEDDHSGEDGERDYKQKLFLVASSRGGLGASLLCRELAREFSSLGRTLHVDISGGEGFENMDPEKGGISDLIYSFLSEPKEIFEGRIEEWIQQSKDGYFRLRGVSRPEDLWVLREEEILAFWKTLAGHFDHVLLDSGKMWTPLGRILPKDAGICFLYPEGKDPSEEMHRMHYSEKDPLWLFQQGDPVREEEKMPERSVIVRSFGKEQICVLPYLGDQGDKELMIRKGESLFRRNDGKSGSEETFSVLELYRSQLREAVDRMG